VGHVICVYCRQPYEAASAASAIRCPKCSVMSAEGQDKCVACGTWIVVACVFCGAHSPHTKSACVSCGELFAGAAERKAAREADAEEDDEDEDDDSAWESGWAWCGKCQALVYDEDPAGKCAAGGKHDTSDSEGYFLCVDPESIDGQGEWRWCRACQGLFHGGERAGVCAASGAHHDGSDSEEYAIAKTGSDDYDEDEGGWGRCKKCSSLVWAEDGGSCAAGGEHAPKESTDYSVPYEEE
jgi:DNA-directed RNA polymerase subunit RPC12/RpoP